MAKQAASLAARTDQTKLCTGCMARYGGAACPSCGTVLGLDLSRPEERARANDLLRQSQPQAQPFIVGGRRTRSLDHAASAVAVGFGGVGALSGHWLPWLLCALGGGVVASRFALAGGRRPLGRARRRVRSGKVLVGVLPPTLPAEDPERVTRGGSVQCEETLVAPLSGEPCIAYRLVGRVGECLVDDAAAAPFTIVSRDGPRVAVLASASILQLPVQSSVVAAGALERIESFLRERGLCADGAPVELAEGVLFEGEEVVVQGMLESVASGKGYRGTAASEFIVGRSDAPVLIKKT